MKLQLLTATVILLLAACIPAEDYRVVRKEVVEEHDKVMLDSERAAENKLKVALLLLHLDSLKKVTPDLDTAKLRADLVSLENKLDQADHQMEIWMKEFDAELGDKSNSEAVVYFNDEKLKLRKMDTLFQKLLGESGEYLRKY